MGRKYGEKSNCACISFFFLSRYCLFGLNIELTEKLESTSKPMRIHVSSACQELLPPQYKTELRVDEPEVKEKVHSLSLSPLTKISPQSQINGEENNVRNVDF